MNQQLDLFGNKVKPPKKRKRRLTNGQKLRIMKAKNPLVSELINRFKLTVDK